jgi:hypothetical protein
MAGTGNEDIKSRCKPTPFQFDYHYQCSYADEPKKTLPMTENREIGDETTEGSHRAFNCIVEPSRDGISDTDSLEDVFGLSYSFEQLNHST